MIVGQSGMLEVVDGVTVSDPQWHGGIGLCSLLYHAGAFKAWHDCLAANLTLAALLSVAYERGTEERR